MARRDVYFSDSDRVEFGQQLATMHERFGIEVHAYCLMNNHYHLLLRCPDGGLSDGMQRLGSNYTRHVNDRLGRDGPLFSGRFSSRLVMSDAYAIGLVRYIHRNALDVRGVVAVDRYRWSSHRSYIGARTVPAWLNTAPVLAFFDGDRDAFHRYVAASDTARPPTRAHLGALSAAAESVVDLQVDGSTTARRLASTVVLLLIDELPLDQQQPLLAGLGLRSATAVRSARSRARARLRERPDIADLVAQARSLALGHPLAA